MPFTQPSDAIERGIPPDGRTGRAQRLTGNANARKHGASTLKRAVKELGSRAIDRRTATGKALAAWRSELLADLGGIEAVSTQELALVEEAVKTKLILDSVDAWLLTQPTLIHKRNRSVLPAVRDRQALVSTLRGLLGDLGLKRRAKAMPSLGEYLATRGGNGGGDAQHRPQSDAPTAGQATASTGADSSQEGAAGT
ncbi:MAG: hypothetical protein ABSA52_20820 [Candidatus Binatia bacterium]